MAGKFELSFAGVPFIGDRSRTFPAVEGVTQATESLYDRVNRLIPLCRVEDLYNSTEHPGRNTGALARQLQTQPGGERTTQVGEWYYPSSAVRYSVFRGLATSTQAKTMLAATQGRSATFVMKCEPDSPYKSTLGYEIRSPMEMLPPRPLAEHGGQFDGLYLVTLVDERWNWRGVPFTPELPSTWEDLIDGIAARLGVTLTYSSIDSVYGQPDPDSQLWCCAEDAALLLDAVAYNVGRTVVRHLNGTYGLYTPEESAARVRAARSKPVTRIAGGDIYQSGGTMKAGDLGKAKNSVCPQYVHVTFPKYVVGDDPIPHYYNGRKDTVWFQDSYGDCFTVTVPITSGGAVTSGLTGNGELTLQDTCKAVYSSEDQAANGSPSNVSDLTALAVRLAGDYYGTQASAALDEVYPGAVAWPMDGLHDVVWTYSERAGVASCRVTKSEWTAFVKLFQHSLTDTEGLPGGPLVPQTMRDDRTDTVYTVNLTTFYAPLRVEEGVRTSGGVNEALVKLGTNGQPYGGGTVNNPGGGYGGTVYYENTTFNYLGGGGGGGSSTYNTINFFGGNVINYGPGGTSSSEQTAINVYGGTTQYFYSGSTTSYEDSSSLVVNVTEGANLTIINYPTDPNTPGLGCPKFYTFYQHLKNIPVSVGQTLTPGQKIGELAPIDQGAHLHFALGDSYTPVSCVGDTLLGGTWSFVGNTIDLNPGSVWFPIIGTRVAGGEGPTAPTLTAKQIAWIRQRLRRPIDGSFYWVQHLGSQFHVGKDYYACDVHTSPRDSFDQDVGKSVYQLANTSDITSRVIYVGEASTGGFVVIQHEKNSDGCSVGPLTPPGTPDVPPESSYESETTIFIQNWSFTSLTFVNLTFVNLNVEFTDTSVVTFNSPVYFFGLFNLCSWWWWCYYNTTIVDDKVPPSQKTITRITDTISGTTIRQFDTPRTGERRTIINTTDKTMSIENTIATASGIAPGISGYIAPGQAISTPNGTTMTWGPGETIETWYDEVTGATRILSITGAGGSDAYTVKATTNDTTPGFLTDKLVAGTGISLTLNNAGSNESYTIATGTGPMSWVKYTKTYLDFSAASTSNTITLASLGPKQFLMAIVIKHSTSFTGGGTLSYAIDIGKGGGTGTDYVTGFDVRQAVSDTALTGQGGGLSIINSYPTAGTWTVTATAQTGGANLNAVTAGSVDVWLLVGTLP